MASYIFAVFACLLLTYFQSSVSIQPRNIFNSILMTIVLPAPICAKSLIQPNINSCKDALSSHILCFALQTLKSLLIVKSVAYFVNYLNLCRRGVVILLRAMER